MKRKDSLLCLQDSVIGPFAVDNIKMALSEIWYEDVDWIYLA
jgi:hypothetical protein